MIQTNGGPAAPRTPPAPPAFPPRGDDPARLLRLYETILSTTDDFAYVFDTRARFLYANQRLLRVWDKTLDQVVGKTCLDLGYPDWHAAMHQREVEEIVRTKKPIRGEVPFTGDSGIFGIYDYILKPVLDAEGNVEAVVGTTRDVTDRQRTEEVRHRLAAVVESSDDAILSKTLEGIITSWNAGAERIFGYTAGEAVGQPIFLLIPKELQGEEPEILARLRRGERIDHYETVRLAKDGRRVHVSLTVSPLRDAGGKVIGASKIARDITEDRRRQEALRESEARFRTLADAAPMMIWEADAEQQGRYFNQTWLRFTGRKLEQELGHGWTGGVHPDDLARCERVYGEAFAARAPFELEYRQRHHSGGYRWVLGQGTPRFGPQGTFQGYIGACIDITENVASRQSAAERGAELERLVEERTASLREAVAQMEEFSYSVSHDLRSPLRAMQGYAAALLEDYGGTFAPEGRDFLERIASAGARMERLTRDVLVYSKIPRAEMPLREVALDKLVSDIVHQYLQDRTGNAEITIEGPLPPVLGNESFLAQAVSNLVGNAVKFCPPGRAPRVRVRAERRDDRVRLWVEDNGIGIRPEHQARIWGMFERIHPQHLYEGTGIGLAIVRKTVERMNGAMGVESAGDGASGSRFWIELPAWP